MKKIFSVLLVLLLAMLAFGMVSCGEEEEEEEEEVSVFETVVENVEELVNEDVEYMKEAGDKSGQSLFRDCFYSSADLFDGEILNSLYCENEGEGEWWCIIAFECASEEDAEAMKEAALAYPDDDIPCLRVEGNVFIASNSEDYVKIALG